jgi:hypothetical protein
LGFLTRKREGDVGVGKPVPDPKKELLPKIDDLGNEVKGFSSTLVRLEKDLKEMPNASDYRLLASEVSRLQTELERMEAKHKEGMLAMYAQIHKELRAIKGEHVIEIMDVEPVTEEKLEEASDQLSELAKTWRKRRAQPGSSGE